jgi:hypothetical protein
MARGKLTMKRCPNGKRRSCPKKAKKCTLKKLSAKAKTFKPKTKKALNAKAKTFSMKKGGKKKAKKKAAKKGSYIKFMSCEIKKIKKQNPKMSHKAAFKKAAANWSK